MTTTHPLTTEDKQPKISRNALESFGRSVFIEQPFVDLYCSKCKARLAASWGEWIQVEASMTLDSGAVTAALAKHICAP